MTRDWQRQVLIVLALFALLGGIYVIYQPGLDGPLLLDDVHNLKPLKRLEVDPGLWREAMDANSAGPLGRPVSVLSFVGNWLTSGPDVRTLKYTNLMLHLLGGVLVFWLSGRLLQERTSRAWLAALWVAALWLSAPLFVSTVLYVIQRMAQLAAVFVFAGLICYVIGRQNADRRPWLAVALIGSTALIWTPLAMLSKENGALLPLLAFLVEVVFFRFRAPRPFRVFLVSGYVLGLALPLMLGVLVLVFSPERLLDGYASRPFSLTERLLTEARVVVDYARNLVAPQHTTLGVYHDDYVVSKGLLQPHTTLLAIAAIAGLALLALRYVRRDPADLLAFGVLFFLAGHLIESSVFPLELYFEHRNYLPGFGVFFLATAAVVILWERVPKTRAALLAAALVVPGILMASTQSRVQIWESKAGILTYAATFHPDSARAQTHIALHYARHRDIKRALQYAGRAKELTQASTVSASLLDMLLHCLAHTPVPDALYARLELGPPAQSDESAAENLSVITEMVLDGACPALDAERLVQALDGWINGLETFAAEPTRWKIHAFSAKLAGHLQQYESALRHVDRAQALTPGVIELSMMRVYYLLQLNRVGQAEVTLRALESLRESRPSDSHLERVTRYYRSILENMDADGEQAQKEPTGAGAAES